MMQAQPHQPHTSSQSPAGSAGADVSQDDVLLEWSCSTDDLKRQWAAWYISNPSEWIEYKSQYASKQTQQQQKQQAGTPTASPTPQVMIQPSPERNAAQPIAHSHAVPTQPLQHAPQQHSDQQNAAHEQSPQQQSLTPAWQQPPWQQAQQTQQQYEQVHHRQPGSDHQPQQWPPPSLVRPVAHMAQLPASSGAPVPRPAHPQTLQTPAQHPPWATPAAAGGPLPAPQPRSAQAPPQAQPHIPDRGRDGPGLLQPGAPLPWQPAPQRSGALPYARHGGDIVSSSQPPWTQQAAEGPPTALPAHPMSHTPGPWSDPNAPAASPAAAVVAQQPPPGASAPHGMTRGTLPPHGHPPGDRPAAAAGGHGRTAPHNDLLGAAPAARSGGTDAERHREGGAKPERRRQSDRPQGFVRGGRHKPRPPPASNAGPPRSWSGPGVPASGTAWMATQDPTQRPGGSGSPSGFAGNPGAAARPPASVTAGKPHLSPRGAPMTDTPHGQSSPHQWPHATSLPLQPPPSGPSGAQPPWISGAAPRGPAFVSQGEAGLPGALTLPQPTSGQGPAGPGSWPLRPPAPGPPPGNGALPAAGQWQAARHAGGDAAGGRGARPLQGPPAAPPGLGPPRPLAGGLSQAPPGVLNAMPAIPPAMQQLGPPPPRGALAQEAPRPPANPAAPLQGRAGSVVGLRPRAEFDTPPGKLTGSPTPRPGRMYGMHSPQQKSMEPTQQRHGRAAGPAQPQLGAVQSGGLGGGIRPPSNGMHGVRGTPAPHQGRPMPGDGMLSVDGLGAPGHEYRPPGFALGPPPQAPGLHFQGPPLMRPQVDAFGGPPRPMGGPNMPMPPGAMPGMVMPSPRVNGPYMPPFSPARPHF